MTVILTARSSRLRNLRDNIIAARVMQKMLNEIDDFDDVELRITFTRTEVIGAAEKGVTDEVEVL